MIRLFLYIKYHCSFLWQMIESLNSFLFYVCYRNKLKSINSFIAKTNKKTSYQIILLSKDDMLELSRFFSKQPEDSFIFFKPHDFDYKSLVRKNGDKSFIMLGVKDKNQLIGYGFLRCFMNGKSFRGKIVDIHHQGKGIAKHLGETITLLAENLDLRLFATISRDNVKSIASSKAVNNIRVIKELPDNYLYVEYLKK